MSWKTSKLAYGFLGLVVIELILRGIGFALLVPSNNRNLIHEEDAKKLRILALGESTTADLFSEGTGESWPRQLEAKLHAAGISARVYNEGLAATTTAFIVSRVPDYLDLYHPDIVISMMGVNDHDSPTLRYDSSFGAKIRMWVSRIRLFRVVTWLADSAKSKILHCSLEEELPDRKTYDSSRAIRAFELAKHAPISEVEAALRAEVKEDHAIALILGSIGYRLQEASNLKARPYLDRAYELYPRNYYIALMEMVSLRTEPTDSRCVKVSQELLACNSNLSDALLTQVSLCSLLYPGISSSIFRSRQVTVGNLQKDSTAYHYRTLNSLLRQRGILHLAMQYPTISMEGLKSYFKGPDGGIAPSYKDIIFVSNRENFLAALKAHSYKELFLDRFGGSWGHLTNLGNSIIAERVFSEIETIVQTTKSSDRRTTSQHDAHR